MKKRLVVFLMAAAMSLSMLSGCGSEKKEEPKAEETQTEEKTEEKKEGEYQFVSAEDAVKATDVHVLDVREWANYTAGRIANSEWCPIFPLENEDLVDVMKDYSDLHFQDDKDIYLVCNSGQRGAQKATATLIDAGIDAGRIYTVEGGAKALAEVNGALTTNRVDENIEWTYAKAADVLADKEGQIVDVRDADTYKAGHLKGSVNAPLKEIESADAQIAFYELAIKELNPEKPVYLLCYSGNKCAKTGVSILKDAGFDTKNVFIIENGAKDADIAAAFVQE